MANAAERLKNLGGESLGEYPEGTDTQYSYTISTHTEDIDYYLAIDLITPNSIVQSIRVVATFGIRDATVAEPWERWYSIRGIFQQLGQPDRVFIDASQAQPAVLIIYLAQGLTFGLGSPSWIFGDGICTGTIISPLHFTMRLNDIDHAEAVYTGTSPTSGLSVGRPVAEVLGIDEAEFYQRVLSETSLCFDMQTQNP
jgi:hypothetical protein